MVKTVEDYIAALPPAQARIAEALRAAIASAAPEATAAIKWAQPVFEAGGPACYFKAHRNHVTFGFWRGADLTAIAPALQSAGKKMAHLKIANDGKVDSALVARLVKAAVQLNRVEGDPTKAR